MPSRATSREQSRRSQSCAISIIHRTTFVPLDKNGLSAPPCHVGYGVRKATKKPPRSSGTYAPELPVCEYRATPRALSTSRNAKWQSDCGLVTNKEFVHGCERS